MKLEARDINFSYKDGQPILKNLSLTIESGERVGIVARSGFGKSTLASILGGYQKPESGEILLDQNPLSPGNPGKAYPVQIIYQHPEKALNPRFKMEKSLNEGWIPGKEMRELFGIREQWLGRWPHELSGGELQRFCTLRVLVPELKFLVADEISTMLDPITQAQIWAALLDVAKKRSLGLAIITHNQALAEKVCTRIVNLENI